MEVRLPKKFKRRFGRKNHEQVRTYVLISEFSHHGLYQCVETGFRESFQRNYFRRKPSLDPRLVSSRKINRGFGKNEMQKCDETDEI